MIRRGIRRAFRFAPRREADLVQQVEEEIALHLDLRAEQLARQGLTPEAARREAERRFGAMDVNRRALRRTAAHREQRMRFREQLESLWYDLRHAARALRRDRALATVVVVTLALGIGATASMFGVIDRLLLTGPAHVRDADGLRRLYVSSNPTGTKENTGTSFGYVMLARLREHAPTLTGVAAYTGARDEVLGRGLDARPVRVKYATSELFPLLGVRPALGRFFVRDDERPPAGELVAVLDHGLWRRRFGADSGVIGRSLQLGERTFTIVGVAPRGFTGADLAPVDVWLPVSASADMDDWPTTHAMTWLNIVARLAPGATEAQAGAQATALHRAEFTERGGADLRLSLRPIWYDVHGNEAPEVAVSRWLIGVSAVLLLVACANVANLLLVRGVRRRREIAVRLALGVGRARLVRLLLAEGLLLAVGGGVAGAAVAYGGVHLLRATLLDGIAWDVSPVNGRVLACAAATTLATALLVALLPALRSSDPRLAVTLRSGTPQAGARRSPLRAALTVTQAALSVVLLVGAGLFVRSLWNVRHLDIGLEPDHVLQVTMVWPESPATADDSAGRAAAAAERARKLAARDAALQRLRALPGVTRAAAGWGTPLNTAFWAHPVVPGRDSLPSLPGGGPYVTGVTEDYFATMGTSIVRGRGIVASDVEGSEPVAVVNETMARTLWPAGDAVGQCFRENPRATSCLRIVGVVEDTPRFELREEPAMQFYVAARQLSRGTGTLLVRADAALAPSVQRAVQELEPSLVHVDVSPLADVLAPQLRPWRLGASLFALFGALALAVAGVGLYSVMSYSAASRTREMGVRLALGAQAGDVRTLVLRHGLALGLGGVLLGALLALAAGRWVAPLLFDTSPREPVVFVVVTATLLVTAVLASAVPAWRAGRTSPSVALRAE